MTGIIFISYKRQHKKTQQTKENQLFSIFYVGNWWSEKKYCLQNVYNLTWRKYLTNQNSLRLKLNFCRQSMLKKPRGNPDIR